jgi:hypothetical protein
MSDRIRHRIKMKICGGGPASHIDQGRHSRFTARVLQRPGRICPIEHKYVKLSEPCQENIL